MKPLIIILLLFFVGSIKAEDDSPLYSLSKESLQALDDIEYAIVVVEHEGKEIFKVTKDHIFIHGERFESNSETAQAVKDLFMSRSWCGSHD